MPVINIILFEFSYSNLKHYLYDFSLFLMYLRNGIPLTTVIISSLDIFERISIRINASIDISRCLFMLGMSFIYEWMLFKASLSRNFCRILSYLSPACDFSTFIEQLL